MLESRSSNFVVSRTIAELVASGAMEIAEGAGPAAPEVLEPEAAAAPVEEFLGSEGEIASLLTRAQAGLREGDFEKSLRMLKAAQNIEPDSPRVRSALKGAESLILAELKKIGIGDQKVPHLRRPIEQLSGMNFSPNEGFILSRINGQWDVELDRQDQPDAGDRRAADLSQARARGDRGAEMRSQGEGVRGKGGTVLARVTVSRLPAPDPSPCLRLP